MNVVLDIPDAWARRLCATGQNLSRRALEALALEEYRVGRLTRPELRRVLGMETRAELDGFLKLHGIDEAMTEAEFARDRQDLDQLGL